MSNLRWLSLCRLLGSFALLSRGWIVPVGGSTPDRLKDDRLKDDRLKDDRLKDDRLKVARSTPDRIKDSFALLSRGWIVPVGGSTPDRLKIDRLKVGSRSAQGRGGLTL